MPAKTIAMVTPMSEPVRRAVAACAKAGQELHFATSTDPEALRRLVADADAIVPAATWVTAGLLDAAPRLRLIQKWGIGVDKIDLEAARARGVTVAITAGASAGPVAEHALALMLAVYRRLPAADRQVRTGQWDSAGLRAVCRQIAGRTVGLVGFGNIARLLAHRLRGFDVELLYHDVRRVDPVTERGFGVRAVDFDTLLSRSDIVSLHLPLTDGSRGLMNASAFARMRDGAVLINTARGEIVDETALLDALRSGKLGGAGLDTLAGEPVPVAHPLLALDNVVLTPHSAGSVIDNVANIASHIFDNIDRFFRGVPLPVPDLIVNPGPTA